MSGSTKSTPRCRRESGASHARGCGCARPCPPGGSTRGSATGRRGASPHRSRPRVLLRLAGTPATARCERGACRSPCLQWRSLAAVLEIAGPLAGLRAARWLAAGCGCDRSHCANLPAASSCGRLPAQASCVGVVFPARSLGQPPKPLLHTALSARPLRPPPCSRAPSCCRTASCLAQQSSPRRLRSRSGLSRFSNSAAATALGDLVAMTSSSSSKVSSSVLGLLGRKEGIGGSSS